MGATNADYGPTPNVVPIVPCYNMRRLETWPCTEPGHSGCVACLPCWILFQFTEDRLIRSVCDVEPLWRISPATIQHSQRPIDRVIGFLRFWPSR